MDQRICSVCNSGEVGDEFPYLLDCSVKKNVKRSLITYLDKGYICGLMNMTSKSNTVKVARIVSCIF